MADAAPGDVTTLRIYLTSLDAYRQAGAMLAGPWREVFDRHLPAITMVQVAGLVEDDALLEVEAEALIKGSA
ncbi:MAG: Rid family hydrolase [Acidimicrobiia bacterium]